MTKVTCEEVVESLETCERVTLTKLRVKDIKEIMDSSSGKSIGEHLQYILRNHTDLNSKDIKHLDIADAFYLMVSVRNYTFKTTEHSFKVKCSDCGRVKEVSVDLADQKVNPINKEIIKVVLEDCGKAVEICSPTLATQLKIDHYIKTVSKGNRDYSGISEGVAEYIYSVGGVTESTIASKVEFIDNLTLYDNQTLNDKINELDNGIDLIIETTCDRCGSEEKYIIDLGASFFRPRRA
jgi:hypothetical protein